uniref:Ovule protein n=1 Tax=Heterorhabditis bacteriophora TaxID=37862 RepID=A0A1I7WGP6_HETBA
MNYKCLLLNYESKIIYYIVMYFTMTKYILLIFSLSLESPQLKTTACCGHKLDGLIFPKDFSWDLGPVTETASP